ncbi:IS4/Tn5 family transposase DNA-binding protein [Sphingobium xenophagum]|uniref:IS4/Tn5 family transposase DNA-binding protein n=1 Tax=Sphingobium xenophagum TaxID=121428 RepID=UPI0039C8EEE6
MDRETSDITSWIDRELTGSRFSDQRLGKRLRKLLVQLDAGMGEPLPLACRDWANTCGFR